MREIYETREEYEMAMRSGIGNNYILPMESNEEVKVLQEKLDIAVKECQQLKEKLEKAEATLLEIDGGWVTDEIRSKISEYFVYAIGEKK